MSNIQTLQTTFPFTLPIGFLDEAGNHHQQGLIRRATGRDTFDLYNNPQSWDNPSYGVLIILSRTIVQLGTLTSITAELLEQLFLSDLRYLVEFYNAIALEEAQLSLSGE